jgi:DNA repair protein RadC
MRSRQYHLAALMRALRENGRLLAALAERSDAAGLLPSGRAPTFHRPADVAAYLGPEMAHLPQEQLRVVLLDRRNRLIGATLVYQGSQTETSIRLADCFREAVRCSAAALIFVHCHPSGDPTPSPDDVRLTREAGEAGMLLGISVLDHLVIAADGFVSLRQAALYVPPGSAASAGPLGVDSTAHIQVPPVEGRADGRSWGCDCRDCAAQIQNPASLQGNASSAPESMQRTAA